VVAAWRDAAAQTDTALAFRATHLRIDAMLMGAVLAAVVARVPRPSRPAVALAVGVLIVASYGTFLVPLLEWGFVLVALASTVLIAEALWWGTGWRWLARVGVISYGVYLFHFPIGLWLGARGTAEPLLPVLTLAGSLALAEVSFRLVEDPIRRRRRRAVPPVAAVSR
jgi:peptidoglycan/LPS O-acetylase OafA/YrhL